MGVLTELARDVGCEKTKGWHIMNIFDHYRQRYEAAKDEEFTLQDFLTICRQDRS
ncbi:hypothetical protein MJN47_29540, partial [Salmonella enterica subsp. enterica serovar Lubbock]|nr:hypothetical protein [Salmonella enterica subsp. enterica serovar Lubbock]